ncbi:hypothetical protein SAMN05443665_105155 [Actinomadura meyerae]|uniref:Uncharacterized protein n=1 Tax=Actinomadura meyerae TaxID=240840 RepID=A0A239NXG7_9ACTN|nr:hypothetical protein [Actinomadura meyerae]SNT59108.1 hypothetical protein SAMN05443665_105155 [Actinomadura meyerae]
MTAQTERSSMSTHCADCKRPLLLRRPGRTHCEACRPTMLASAEALYRRLSTTQEDRT